MNAPAKLPKHGRIREKYNPTPSAGEKAFHLWLIDSHPCACGCGAPAGVVHHILAKHPDKRWRRDHEFVVPMNGACHMALHAAGSEAKFQPGIDYAWMAEILRKRGKRQGFI